MTRRSDPRLKAGRWRNGDGIAQVQRGSLEPGGPLVPTLKHSEPGTTTADIAKVTARPSRAGELPGAAT
jgi:hypothetical protein